MSVRLRLKVIPQYCTAHPVLRIITRNKIQWRLSLLEGSYARKMGVSKGMVGKKRWKFVARRIRQLNESFEIVESAKTSFLSRTWQNILNQGETSTGAMIFSS